MTDHGETPGGRPAPDETEIGFGETLFTGDGVPVGTVRGVDEEGFFVTTRDGVEALSVEHVRSGHEFGAAELVWRCIDCGRMGPIDGDVPDGCPDCGAPRENLMYWTED